MTTDWKDLPTMQDVACAQADGWEVEARISARPEDKFEQWSGIWWEASYVFRGRPRQPAMNKVKFKCFSVNGQLGWRDESLSAPDYWVRVPSEDKTVEVPV
jgi:hypothetical protein